MYTFFKLFHSGLRFVVLILILVAIIQSLAGWLGKKPYTETNRKINLFAMISAHVQLLVGLILYFVSPLVQFNSSTMQNPTTRYWTVEHIFMMIFAIALITVGYSKSKKETTAAGKHRYIALMYILGVVVIVAAIVQSQRPLFGITG
jgi:hypothetical protein